MEQGPGWAPFRRQDGSSPEPLPICLPPPTPYSSQEGPLGPGSGQVLGGEGSSVWAIPHPHTHPSPPAQLIAAACTHRKQPDGALLRRPRSVLQTLVGWEPPSPRGREGGNGFRTQPGQVTSPQGRDQSRVLEDPRKGLLSAPGPNGSCSPSHHFRMGEREGCGGGAVQVLGKRMSPHPQALERYHVLREPPPRAQGSGTPQPSVLFQPLPGEEKGDPDLPAKIWGGGLRNPQNVLLRNLEAKRMGEGPGGWHLCPSPQALGRLQEGPPPASHLAMGRVQRQGDGHSDHWGPEVPQSGRRETKVRPNGCRVGRGPSPNPTISGICPLGGLSVPRPPCSLGADGGASPDG